MVKPTAFRRAVGMLQADFAMSQRRACTALGFARSSCQYRTSRPAAIELLERLHALAVRRPRLGYRRVHVLVRREGVLVIHKRV